VWLWTVNDMISACQHLNSGTNLGECEVQSWFKVQATPAVRFDWFKMFSRTPWDVFGYPWSYTYPRFENHCFRVTKLRSSVLPVSRAMPSVDSRPSVQTGSAEGPRRRPTGSSQDPVRTGIEPSWCCPLHLEVQQHSRDHRHSRFTLHYRPSP
jgi:hypothetical protein